MQIGKISDNYSECTKSRITVGRDGANQSAPRHRAHVCVCVCMGGWGGARVGGWGVGGRGRSKIVLVLDDNICQSESVLEPCGEKKRKEIIANLSRAAHETTSERHGKQQQQ